MKRKDLPKSSASSLARSISSSSAAIEAPCFRISNWWGFEGKNPLSCEDDGEEEDEMSGGVGFEEVDSTGEREVDLCRSGFVG